MLKAKGLLNYFWAEAIHTAAYILNRSPTSALDHQTPFEAWNGWKPKVTHFKIFGCIAYVHVPSQKKQKLDDNSVKCIFVGYSSETKGYRFFNPLTKQLIVSRDVVFDEKNAWNWDELQYSPGVICEDDSIMEQGVQNGDDSSFSTPRLDSFTSTGVTPPSSPPRKKMKSLVEIYEQIVM